MRSAPDRGSLGVGGQVAKTLPRGLDGESLRRCNRLCGPGGLDRGTGSGRSREHGVPQQEPVHRNLDAGDGSQAESEHDRVGDDERGDGQDDGDGRGGQDEDAEPDAVIGAVGVADLSHRDQPFLWLRL
jgi:hypothetical protein